ncbi:alpha/beta hydrolase family protein [Bradyrhizobium canariense]|uniref:Predicted hydrolase of the alpha/beta-hydrolase fold n=1 Tax=Bradyrhizobium canariense TaxID=255045 RepID=A0A1H2AI08_9BRAD|nr:alpha/beta fold hydrolase [Bradyrhizobium canariense]SDT45467.1 Predicted hydrolase of the alpha/beta-hydrolase fold [Bradyrhizobium canariense]
MKFLFEDESFSFETLRAAGFAVDGGADLGEIIVTAEKIGEGDEAAWHREWKALAARIEAAGEASFAAGHKVSAREAFLRASNYYRAAEFYRRDDAWNDPEVTGLTAKSRDTFLKAGALFDTPVEDVRIPYGDGSLPAYLFLVDDSGKPRPTIVYNNGFDSTREEAWFAIGAAALRRGYNVIAFDGPGQGSALRDDKLVFRHDWEAVLGPVLDYAQKRPEFASDKLVPFGYSLGAQLIARAAAFDKRPAALILDDGMYDFFDANAALLPGFVTEWVRAGDKDEAVDQVMQLFMQKSTNARWAMRNGVWTTGATSFGDYLRKSADYTLEGIIDRIEAPTLILEAEEDAFLKGQAQKVADGLKAPHKLVTLTRAQGASTHCHMGAMRLAGQTIFDWLDEVLG